MGLTCPRHKSIDACHTLLRDEHCNVTLLYSQPSAQSCWHQCHHAAPELPRTRWSRERRSRSFFQKTGLCPVRRLPPFSINPRLCSLFPLLLVIDHSHLTRFHLKAVPSSPLSVPALPEGNLCCNVSGVTERAFSLRTALSCTFGCQIHSQAININMSAFTSPSSWMSWFQWLLK